MFSVLDISGAGMTANKEWTEAISNNLANMNTTRTNSGGPYKRQTVVFEEKKKFDDVLNQEIGNGVQVKQIVQDNNTRLVYDPEHPDANEEGYVEYPEINVTSEMTDLLMSQRGYEQNATVLSASKKMMEKEHEIGRV
ncbi:flagellar basal body rod protein FlgC [Bacillus cereus]|uniref:flagellar basal body rod protein FlgC n=1 Tax=Bacillus cereus TaxID=1396 RepID=UPI000B4A8D56|nr:flagellar basal body rod protein FlgC [Bacillus cereus]